MKEPEAESLRESCLRSQGMSEKDVENQLFKERTIYQDLARGSTFTKRRLESIAQEELRKLQK